MAIRWRRDGRLMCAATTGPEEGDTYIGDRLTYELSVILKVIVADKDHKKNSLWHWTQNKMAAENVETDIKYGYEVEELDGALHYRGSSTDWCWFKLSEMPQAYKDLVQSSDTTAKEGP